MQKLHLCTKRKYKDKLYRLEGRGIIMPNNKYDFTNVSMIGRFAYAVMCAERYALAKYPEKDWKPLFKWMWKGTSDYFDEWYYRFMEILPEYLYEFDNYKDAAFDYLSEENYNYYAEFLKDIDKNMEELLVTAADLTMVYSYTEIPGKGKESINLLNKAIKILEDNNIELPDPEALSFTPFSEKHGWGENFDGTRLSIILK